MDKSPKEDNIQHKEYTKIQLWRSRADLEPEEAVYLIKEQVSPVEQFVAKIKKSRDLGDLLEFRRIAFNLSYYYDQERRKAYSLFQDLSSLVNGTE